tara:strand:+ start:1163 stop:2488 length:1326 start_codon:yes stop_codon:yes gene_type:complete
MVGDFFPYSQERLGFDQPVTVIFQSDEENSHKALGKTAYYDPANYEVVLYVDGRHPKDIMRSLSHELVHHAQNCRGDFTQDDETYEGYAQENPHLRNMEREAYTKGNLIFRDYEDLIKTGKKEVDIDFTNSGEPKMSLKEWKNAELNRNLMKKWGLLKEAKKPDADGDKIPDWADKNPNKAGGDEDRKPTNESEDQVPAFLEEDSEGEETYHYGEDEGRDDRELHDLIKRHATRAHIDALKRDMEYDEDHEDRHERGTHFREGTEDIEEGIFSPNHYCVHHGGVQHEGQVKMAEAINHNFDKKLNKVTWYDMKLQDGTILERVAAEDIMVTNASLAEGHHHAMRDDEEDDLEEAEGRGKDYRGIGSKAHADEEGNRPSMARDMDLKGARVTKAPSARLGKRRSLRGMKAIVQEKTGSDKISVREAKEITRQIIERIRQGEK